MGDGVRIMPQLQLRVAVAGVWLISAKLTPLRWYPTGSSMVKCARHIQSGRIVYVTPPIQFSERQVGGLAAVTYKPEKT